MARGQLPRTDRRRMHPTGAHRNTHWDRGGDKAHRTRESAHVKLLAAELPGPGRHKTQAQPSLRFCGVPENWNRPQHRDRSILRAGSLSSVEGESTHP